MIEAIEAAALADFRSGRAVEPTRTGDAACDWLAFGLAFLLESGREIRGRADGVDDVRTKGDGSPATRLEERIEGLLRQRLAAFEPSATIVGEETGGALADSRWSVAIDPIDGTWAFLDGTETYATSLAIFDGDRPIVGLVSGPGVGSFGHAVAGRGARRVDLSVFGEPDRASALPRAGAGGRVRVNVHPGRPASALVEALHRAWRRNDVAIVRSPGGSPSWALLEAAGGRHVYVNLWSSAPAAPYDLAAGVLLVREAGGEVIGVDGSPIDAVGHEGPFVAGVDPDCRDRVAEIVGRLGAR